ncbi:MAG: DUF2239 family protein [Rhizobiaceae bacterium]
MNEFSSMPSTAFEGDRLLVRGALADVALAVKGAQEARPNVAILTFDDATGKVIDLDLRGTDTDVLRRLSERGMGPDGRGNESKIAKAAARGRPKLGVVAREVTLLPRQWEWLAAQPGGASQALRRLVDQARNAGESKVQARAAQEAAYRFMSAMAGNYHHFENALRALFAGDLVGLAQLVDDWPRDVRDHTLRLARAAG